MIYIDGYPIDAAISESVKFSSEITDHPIEAGSSASDHIRNLPDEFTLDCVVSDTPSGDIANDDTRLTPPLVSLDEHSLPTAGLGIAGATLPSKDAYDSLVAMHRAKKTITLECSFGIFRDVGIVSVSPTRDAKTTGGLFFSVELKQLKIVELRRVTVRVSAPIMKRPAPIGKKQGPKSTGVPRKVDTYAGVWFDPDINGWREGASQDSKGQWTYFKGKATDVPESMHHATDAQIRDYIALHRDGALIDMSNKNGIPTQERALTNIGSVFAPDNPGLTFDLDPNAMEDAYRNQDLLDAGYIPLDTPAGALPQQGASLR